jgi:cytoskeletal protein RodZ
MPELEEEEAAPVVESREPLLPADQIFVEIGSQLHERRELISLTVEEVERHTKLRAAFIRALEAGEYDKLPSPVQTRGMLANYATFLDIDADKILLRFADGLQARRHEKYAETPREKIQTEVNPSMPRLRTFITGDLIFGLMMITMLVGLAVWGVGRVISSQEDVIAPTAPSIPDVLEENLPTQSSAGMTFVPVDEGLTTPTLDTLLTVEATPTFESTANVVVEVFALERTFARVSVDGKVVFEGRFAPRESRMFEANDQVVVLTGNGAALRIKYNGEDLGLMGNMGEVISRVYLITGVATPTATVPPTPTNTPIMTITPTPTLTPTFTAPSP